MTCISNMHGSLQAESSVWLFKSPLAGGGSVLCQQHYRLHNLLFSFNVNVNNLESESFIYYVL